MSLLKLLKHTELSNLKVCSILAYYFVLISVYDHHQTNGKMFIASNVY